MNVLWLVLGGIFTALEYVVASLLLMVTIIGIPFGMQTLKLAGLARGQQVTVRYFHADPLCQTDPPLGRYRTVTGTVRGVDWTARVLRLDLEGGHAGPGLEKARGLDVSLDALEAVL